MRKSILQPQWPYDGRIPPDARCLLCGAPAECRHHVYPGNPNRRISEENGFWAYLCNRCHNGSPRSVHMDASLSDDLKRACQVRYEQGHTREQFRALVGRSWL